MIVKSLDRCGSEAQMQRQDVTPNESLVAAVAQAPDRRPRWTVAGLLLLVNGLALLAVATWFRCRSLGTIPACSGDEAWYGAQAWWMLQEEPFSWQTPGGNPMNALFIVPLVMAHVYFPPSTALLRSVAVASGLAVLAINWLLCRWVFDRRTATISTVMLAILPIDIAYSRFAWDSCQSLAATLPVLYASLAALRFPRQHGHWIVTAILAQIIAVLVHPTNIFAAVAIATAVIARRSLKTDRSETSAETPPPTSRWRIGDPWQWGMIAVLGACLAVWAFDRLQLPVAGFLTQRFGELHALSRPAAPPDGLVLYARLFTGGTVYRYFAGSRSWMEWPLPDGIEGWGIDVVVFWAVTLAAAWFLWRSWKRSQRNEDGGLIACWILGLAAFLLIADCCAMVPGGERFALCLIGPAVLLTARRGVAGLGIGDDEVARAVGRRHAWRLACSGRLSATLLPLYRAHRRRVAIDVLRGSHGSETGGDRVYHAADRQSFGMDCLLAILGFLAHRVLYANRAAASRRRGREARSARLSQGVHRRTGVVRRVRGQRSGAAGRVAARGPGH